MSFSRMMHAASHLLPEFYHHPFNQALAKGDLPKSVFREFIWQDNFYLNRLAKAIVVTSEKMDNIKHTKQLKEIANEICHTELNLHRKYLGKEHHSRLFNTPIKPLPVIENHTAYLIYAATHLPIHESFGSLLPCFVMYRHFITRITITSDHPYHLWLSSYSNKQFTSATKTMVKIANELGRKAPYPIYVDKMTPGFVRSVKFEIEFLNHICEAKEFKTNSEAIKKFTPTLPQRNFYRR